MGHDRSTDDAVAVAFYLKTLGHGGPAELLDFKFATGSAREASVRVARVELRGGEESFWFAGSASILASEHRSHVHHFVGIYDSPDMSLVELVGSAFHFDTTVERLGYGHTFPLGSASLLRQ